MAELWDAYDRSFRKIEGMTLTRGEPLPEGVYHLVCDIAVRHTDGSYLLMQRDFRKPLGGLWELTAAGSALRGESPLDCARRELWEETGIAAQNLQELGRVTIRDSHYVEYLCITDQPKDSIRLQEGETVNYRWVDRAALLELVPHELASHRIMEFMDL